MQRLVLTWQKKKKTKQTNKQTKKKNGLDRSREWREQKRKKTKDSNVPYLV